VTDATVAFETDFEGCGTCDQSTRISYAQGVLNAYGSTSASYYGASFVSQSFPLATTTMMMTEGDVVPSYIELKNTGTKSWDSHTRIGTTQPRDRVSVFADSSWVADNRPAQVTGTVAPGQTYKFTFNLAATKAGRSPGQRSRGEDPGHGVRRGHALHRRGHAHGRRGRTPG
jgi:hypothetical protein